MTDKQARDDDSFKTLRTIRVLVYLMIYGSMSFVLVPIAIYTLPDLESAWYPPIKDQRIYDEHVKPGDDSYLLFRWSFIKQRRAEPEYITWMAYLPEVPQERYAVDSYIGWDCRRNFRSDRTSQPSPVRVVRDVCLRLPDKLKGRSDVVIDGVFDFRVGHGFYTVPVKIPADDPPTDRRNIPEPLAAPR